MLAGGNNQGGDLKIIINEAEDPLGTEGKVAKALSKWRGK
jgi:hypothetical protein